MAHWKEDTDSTRVIDMMKEFKSFLGRPVANTDDKGFSLLSERAKADNKKIPVLDLEQNLTPIKEDLLLRNVLKRKLVEKDIELQQVQAENGKLKRLASEQKVHHETQRIRNDIEFNKRKLNIKCENCSKMRQELKFLESQEEEKRNRYSEKISQLEMENVKITNNLKTTKKQFNSLQDEIEQVKSVNVLTIDGLRNELIQLKMELLSAKNDLKNANEHTVQKQLLIKQESNNLAEKTQLQNKIQELESELNLSEESKSYVESMQSDIKRLIVQEREATRLRDENRILKSNSENTTLLKEKLISLQEQICREENQQDLVFELKMDNQSLRHKLDQWETLAKGENCSPATVSSRLSQLQKNELLLKEETGNLKAELLACKMSKTKSDVEYETLSKDYEKSRNEVTTLNQKLRKLQPKHLLLRRQCEGYQRIINSYESEATINFASMEKERIGNLESLIEEYKKILDGEGINVSENIGKNSDLKKCEMENEILKSKLSKLEDELSKKMKTEKEENYRVFHYRNNPASLYQEKQKRDFQTLKEENEKLKSRVQILNEKMMNSSLLNVTALTNERMEIGANELVQTLREQINSAEQKNKRLMDAFKLSSQEFRETCYLLTGYKMDMISRKKYKLSHVFAESSEDHLIFEVTDDQKLQLLETNYSKCLTSLIDEYLYKHNSIPAFLSGLTMDLFNRQSRINE